MIEECLKMAHHADGRLARRARDRSNQNGTDNRRVFPAGAEKPSPIRWDNDAAPCRVYPAAADVGSGGVRCGEAYAT